MQNNYRLGCLITLILYFLEGLATVLVTVIRGESWLSVTLMMVRAWLVSFWLLLRMNGEHGVSKRVYYIAEALFSSALACGLAYEVGNLYIMIFVFWVQWTACTLFLDNLMCKILLGMHILFVSVMKFASKVNPSYEIHWNEFLVIVVVLISICWLTEILINLINSQNRQNKEQEMSLDDMLRLADAMCEEAQLATKSKSNFLSNMSHEIRTPLNSILGMNEMILRESSDKQVLEYATNIESSGSMLLSIINDILDFSKIESGKMEIVPVEYRLSSILNNLVNMIMPRVEKGGLELNVEIEPSIPEHLYGDEVRIRQILTNLLTNAVKYTDIGSVTLKMDYEKTGEDMLNLLITVKDTGCGIKEEDREKLFQSFQRVDETKNRNIEGTGLGLAITGRFVQMMDGTIQVESVYGVGSAFTAVIPQKFLSDEPTGDFKSIRNRQKSREVQKRESFEAPEAKVLVVDDSGMNLAVFKALLKHTKMDIVTASSGKESLELVKAEPFHIIFMDHMMPEMDGIETLHEIQKLTDFPNENTPIIVLTANAISGARESYIKEGFVDFLKKPINADLLEQTVVSYLPKEQVRSVAYTDGKE